MDLPNLLGHLGYVLIALGMLLLARQMVLGWLLRLAGEFTWGVVGFMLDMSSIWFWCLFFICLDVYGFITWKKKADSATN